MPTNIPISQKQKEKIDAFIELLFKWNQKINLVSKHSMPDMWQRHIVDSIHLLKYIKAEDKIVDLGSGGGFPGILLSIMGIKNVTLVESCSKKYAFLVKAAAISDNEIKVINDRAENLNISCTYVTARALGSVDLILDICQKYNIANSILLLKGTKVDEEINLAKQNWIFDYIKHNIEKENGNNILSISADYQKR